MSKLPRTRSLDFSIRYPFSVTAKCAIFAPRSKARLRRSAVASRGSMDTSLFSLGLGAQHASSHPRLHGTAHWTKHHVEVDAAVLQVCRERLVRRLASGRTYRADKVGIRAGDLAWPYAGDGRERLPPRRAAIASTRARAARRFSQSRQPDDAGRDGASAD